MKNAMRLILAGAAEHDACCPRTGAGRRRSGAVKLTDLVSNQRLVHSLSC